MRAHRTSTCQDATGTHPTTRSAVKRGLALLATGGTLILGACGRDGTGPGPALASCNDPMSVEVTVNTAGSQPVFDWSPRCSVLLVLVEREGGDQWLVADQDEDGNSIEPPVTYGVVPSGASERHEAEALVPGVTYDVVLWRLHSDLPDTEVLLAVEEFTL